jgi:hypothetical protein
MVLLNDNKSMLPNIKTLRDFEWDWNREEFWIIENGDINFAQMQTKCMKCTRSVVYL